MYIDLWGEIIKGKISLEEILDKLSSIFNIEEDKLRELFKNENLTEKVEFDFTAYDEIYKDDDDLLNDLEVVSDYENTIEELEQQLKDNSNKDSFEKDKLARWYYEDGGRNLIETPDDRIKKIVTLVKKIVS